MNECEQAGMLGAYHDGEMSPDRRVDFEQHLRQCPQCAAELARIVRLTGLLGCLGGQEMPRSSLDRLHGAVDLLPSAGIIRMARGLTAVAAMILLVCMIGLTRQAPARGSLSGMPLWEAEVVTQESVEPPSSGPEELWASWVVQDLSRRGEYD